MATINQLRIERRAYFAELKKAARTVDTDVEKVQRKINSVLARSRDVPEESDYQTVVDQLEMLLNSLVAMKNLLDSGRAIFSILG